MAQSSNGIQQSQIPPEILEKTDLSIALLLTTWPALSLAVANNWGGSSSAEKRDWLGGAISDLIASTPPKDMDPAYLEEFLLSVMLDEFEVVVDDGSAEEIATEILQLRAQILKGNFAELEILRANWQERQQKGERLAFVDRGEVDAETDDDTDEDDDEDVEMEEAPELVTRQRKESSVVEIDEDGFTKVVSKKGRA